MNDLKKLFEELDSIHDEELLLEMRKSIKDISYTKVFWEQRDIALNGATSVDKARAKLKRFRTPHGFAGIHISIDATIGKGCTFYQHVVIGSNTLPDSKTHGFPVIGDNVYIGAGAMVIGNVRVGNNVRIGANCVVTKDVPDNCVVVGPKSIVIQRDEPIDNTFYTVEKYKKYIANLEKNSNEN